MENKLYQLYQNHKSYLMKTLFKITCLSFLLISFKTTGYCSVNCKILELIVSDMSNSKTIKINELSKTSTDSVGQITVIEDSSYVKSKHKSHKIEERITIIDSFGFFSLDGCNKYKVKRRISRIDSLSNNYYIITGISTGRKNCLAIGIAQKGQFTQVIYYISINGSSATIVDKYQSSVGE
jgi:hypothetical protein